MSLFRWVRGRTSSPTRRRSAREESRNFHPRLEALEDRTLLNGSSFFSPPFMPVAPVFPMPIHFPTGGQSASSDTATQLEVITPRTIEAGIAGKVTIIALDASNHRVSDYTGTVAFTSSDASALLPSNYTFTAKNHGEAVVSVTFETVGNDTLTATDTQTSSITGSGTTIVDAAPVATHFFIEVPRKITAGEPANITVIAEDASNHVVPSYTGTVTLSTGNSQDTLPAPTAFSAADKGKLVLSVTFASAGTETLTATDSSTPPLTGSVSVTPVAAGVVTHFGIFALPFALGNTAFNVYVVALNANNKVVPTYTGTVTFTSSDSSATLPANYQFQSSDDGKHEFSVTLATSGKQTVTVTDTTTSTITATSTIYVFNLPILDPPGPITPPTPVTPPTPITVPTSVTPPVGWGISSVGVNTALSDLTDVLQGFGAFGANSKHKH